MNKEDQYNEKEFNVGDWVTSEFLAGYWRVEKIIMVREELATDENFPGWRKILLLKKGFTDKFLPRNDVRTCHVYWCTPVSKDTAEKIQAYYRENPKALDKFNVYSGKEKGIYDFGILATEEEYIEIESFIRKLPAKFSLSDIQDLNKYNRDKRKQESEWQKDLIKGYIRLINYNHEVNDNHYMLWCEPELVRIH